MSANSIYKPRSPVMQWLERRLPIAGLVYSSFIVYPVPRNLNYWWTFGGILAFMLGAQMLTGIVLAMHYTPHVDLERAHMQVQMRVVSDAHDPKADISTLKTFAVESGKPGVVTA